MGDPWKNILPGVRIEYIPTWEDDPWMTPWAFDHLRASSEIFNAKHHKNKNTFNIEKHSQNGFLDNESHVFSF